MVHSELNGAYDSLALKRASEVKISGYYSLDKLTPTGNVLVHLLIYKIADGTLALSFAQLDEPGGNQQDYYGCAVLETQSKDGKWTAIKSVDTLHDKGIVLRNQEFEICDEESLFLRWISPVSKPLARPSGIAPRNAESLEPHCAVAHRCAGHRRFHAKTCPEA